MKSIGTIIKHLVVLFLSQYECFDKLGKLLHGAAALHHRRIQQSIASHNTNVVRSVHVGLSNIN